MARRGQLGIAVAIAVALLWAAARAAPPDTPSPANGRKATAAAPVSATQPAAGLKSGGLQIRRGEFVFHPDAHETTAVPELFRLPQTKYAFELTPLPGMLKDVTVESLTFASPVHTDHEANNTVHCEYYRPAAPGRYPGCIVLHILGGDFPLSRTFATALAHRGVASLFVIMPYYGPRHDPNSPVRMVSSDARQTVDGMIQAVKDIRVATAWLAEQPEVDPHQLGIFGISLGGITAALAGEAEPRFTKICPVLAGGCVGAVLWDSHEPHVVEARRRWEAAGGTRESLQSLIEKVDPATYAELARGRKILMLNATHDEIIPRKCTELLWTDLGKPKIIWYDSGHITAMWHIADALEKVTDFFQPDRAN